MIGLISHGSCFPDFYLFAVLAIHTSVDDFQQWLANHEKKMKEKKKEKQKEDEKENEEKETAENKKDDDRKSARNAWLMEKDVNNL